MITNLFHFFGHIIKTKLKDAFVNILTKSNIVFNSVVDFEFRSASYLSPSLHFFVVLPNCDCNFM